MTLSDPASIYLDFQASTPLDPSALAAMMPFLTASFGNASSAHHRYGQIASDAVEVARAEVAELLGARAASVIFTSGATEANNLALKGAVRASRGSGRNEIVVSAIEHPAVLQSARSLEAEGFRCLLAPVDSNGRVRIDDLSGLLGPQTALVSVMAASNELGTLQPIKDITAMAHGVGALMHVDAAQAAGKVDIRDDTVSVDLLCISGHKLYGPQGTGALLVRPGIKIVPLLHGGGQERGYRSGSLNVAGCVGLGAACAIATKVLHQEERRTAKQRDRLASLLIDAISNTRINAVDGSRLPGSLHVTFPGADAEIVMSRCPDVAMSIGSACSSGAIGPSHVLRAIGMSDGEAESSIRLSVGRTTTDPEVRGAARAIARAVGETRALTAAHHLEMTQ